MGGARHVILAQAVLSEESLQWTANMMKLDVEDRSVILRRKIQSPRSLYPMVWSPQIHLVLDTLRRFHAANWDPERQRLKCPFVVLCTVRKVANALQAWLIEARMLVGGTERASQVGHGDHAATLLG